MIINATLVNHELTIKKSIMSCTAKDVILGSTIKS